VLEDLKDRTAVVTGGSSGIGRALALALADEGMDVALCATGGDRLEAVAEEVRARGVRALPVVCDVSRRAEVQALAERVDRELGAVSLLCNNAGVTTIGRFAEHDDADWDWVYGVVLMGVVHGIQAFLPSMLVQGAGQILNTGSQAGLVPDGWLHHGPYTSAKAAVIALSMALRPEVAPHGVGVSILIPGGVRTDILTTNDRRPSAGADGGAERAAIVPRPGAPPREAGSPRWLEPERVAARAVQGIRADEPLIITHPGLRPLVNEYFERILSAYRPADG
jgi:NAD(P)-dependent dehydrogenase (short-subunit alcohol dehydrogenase family)